MVIHIQLLLKSLLEALLYEEHTRSLVAVPSLVSSEAHTGIVHTSAIVAKWAISTSFWGHLYQLIGSRKCASR